MDVHAYQAKELLANFGVTIPRGAVPFSPDQAVYAATELGGWHWAVKAQIHSGGRGKAGGIKICRTYHEVHEAARALLGKRLVTAQTGREGKPVQRASTKLLRSRAVQRGEPWSTHGTSYPSHAFFDSVRLPVAQGTVF